MKQDSRHKTINEGHRKYTSKKNTNNEGKKKRSQKFGGKAHTGTQIRTSRTPTWSLRKRASLIPNWQDKPRTQGGHQKSRNIQHDPLKSRGRKGGRGGSYHNRRRRGGGKKEKRKGQKNPVPKRHIRS